ncbi:MAG: 50S ribosomal protein L4 [Negativicutes bacterium]|nr:50S ribosomal protein L4 [Negativicutes bacterium]
MPNLKVFDLTAKEVGEIELNEAIFGVEVHSTLMHQAMVMQLANQRLGTAATKTRAMVRGGGRKPWRQKGTGRARAGTTRSPIWIGGGVVFGPHPRSYVKKMPRKARRLALKSALSAKVIASELLVLDGMQFEAPKTKQVLALMKAFEIESQKALFILGETNENVVKSTRNIPGVKTITSLGLNVVDLLHHDKIFITKDAVAKIEEVLA